MGQAIENIEILTPMMKAKIKWQGSRQKDLGCAK